MATKTDEIVGTCYMITEFWHGMEYGNLQKQFDLIWEKDGEGEYALNDGKDVRTYTISNNKLCDVEFTLYYHQE